MPAPWVRGTIGSALVLALALALFLVLRAERGGRGERASSSSAAGSTVEPSRKPAETLDGGRAPSSAGPEERVAAGRVETGEAGSAATQGMRVLVRDAWDERPIANALVTLFDRATPAALRTAKDGTCLVPVLSFEKEALLRVEAAGHFHSSQSLVPTANLAVELLRSTTLTGRVLAADTGQPVAGALLALQHFACAGCEPESRVSAADGSYEISSVPLRMPARLEVRAEGFAPALRVFELRSDEPETVQDIRLVRGLELAGRVEDWTSGEGVPRAHVGELVADEEGRFHGRILGKPATGRTSFEVQAPGYAMLEMALDAPHEDELGVRLPRLAVLEGRVTDVGGQPIRDASVYFSSAGPTKGAEPPETSPRYELPAGWSYSEVDEPAKSDDDGRYELPVLPWSLNATVAVKKRGFLPEEGRLQSTGEPGSRRRLDWWLKPGEEPTVVEGSVTVNGQGSAALQGAISWRGPSRSGVQRFHRGAYRVEVEPGELTLSATLDVLPHQPSRDVAARLESGALRELDLDVIAPTATISGAVRFKDGTPVAGRDIGASCILPSDLPQPTGLYHHTVTDGSGEYELRVVDVGACFTVGTSDFDGNPLSYKEVSPGATGVDFVFPRGYRLFLRAREAGSGAALAMDAEVQFLARGEPRYGFGRVTPVSLAPDADGWYECSTTACEADLLGLPRAGELPQYGASLVTRVKLDGPAPARVEFALERGQDVALELAEGVAAWPGDHGLLLVAEELWGAMYGSRWLAEHGRYRQPRYRTSPFDELEEQCSVQFDAEGHALVRGLAPGNYRFRPIPGDLLVDPEYVRVDRGTLPVLLRWSRRE